MPPKQTSDQPETGASTTDTPAAKMANDVAAMQDQGMKAMSQMGFAWVENLSDLGSEVLSFVADRIKEDVKTQHKMLHCKNVADLQHIQAEFVQTAIDQYTAETGRLVKMGHDLYNRPEGGGETQN